MQDIIDEILDLTAKLFREKYNFIEVYPRLSFFKSQPDSITSYKGLQLFVAGNYNYKEHEISIDWVAVLTLADETYQEVVDRALQEMLLPRDETLQSIENLIINPSKRKAELV